MGVVPFLALTQTPTARIVYTKRSKVGKMDVLAYPPKNRRASPLPDWLIEIAHDGGIDAYDPVGLILYILKNGDDLLKLKPIKGLYSDLSNSPALLYRSSNVEIALSPEELLRLASYSLLSHEYASLRSTFGVFREITADHYAFELEMNEDLQAQTPALVA